MAEYMALLKQVTAKRLADGMPLFPPARSAPRNFNEHLTKPLAELSSQYNAFDDPESRCAHMSALLIGHTNSRDTPRVLWMQVACVRIPKGC